MTLALVEPKLEEHGIDAGDRLKTVSPRDTVTVGPFTHRVHPRHAQHARLRGAGHHARRSGVIVHTGDFKIDQTPIDGEHFDLHRFAELGAQGVLALFADSTNIDRKGSPGPRSTSSRRSRSCSPAPTASSWSRPFSSSIYRMQVLVDLAAQFERKVAFVGRSIVQNARDRAAARLPARARRACRSATCDVPELRLAGRALHHDRIAGRTAGGALAHRHRRPPATSSSAPDDTVVLSARAIPGNEKAIARTMSHVARRGADVITDDMKHVHVSGHGSAEELKLVLSLVRPRYFVPIHGEYRQLAAACAGGASA